MLVHVKLSKPPKNIISTLLLLLYVLYLSKPPKNPLLVLYVLNSINLWHFDSLDLFQN